MYIEYCIIVVVLDQYSKSMVIFLPRPFLKVVPKTSLDRSDTCRLGSDAQMQNQLQQIATFSFVGFAMTVRVGKTSLRARLTVGRRSDAICSR